MKHIALQRLPSKPVHSVGLVVFVCLLGFLSITKGWLIFFFLPTLIVLSPLLFVTQIWTNNVYNKQVGQPEHGRLLALAQWQVLALFWAFLIAPGLWDTPEMLLFGIIKVPENALWTILSTILTLIAFVAFLSITVWQCVILGKLRRKRAKDTAKTK